MESGESLIAVMVGTGSDSVELGDLCFEYLQFLGKVASVVVLEMYCFVLFYVFRVYGGKWRLFFCSSVFSSFSEFVGKLAGSAWSACTGSDACRALCCRHV